jgi:serine protease
MRHLMVGLAAMAAILASAAHAADPAASERIIVQWKREAPGSQRDVDLQRVRDRTGVALQRLRGVGGRMEVLTLPDTDPATRDRALSALRASGGVEFAEPDRRVRAHALPNDPLFVEQWYLGSTEIAATRASTAWDVTLAGTPAASPVVVAIIDTGVRFEHPDLARAAAGGKLLPGYDFVSADKGGVFATAGDGDGWDPDPSDPGDFLSSADLQSDLYKGKKCGGGDDQEQPTGSSWHGTRVSGLIAAATGNGAGIAGAAYHARVLPVRALGKCGGYDSDVLAAMYWSAGLTIPAALLAGTPTVNPDPARIINMSLGSVGECSAAYRQALSDLTAAGVTVIASAGNDGGPVDSPANCAGAIGVAGLRHAGTKVGYSNLGPQVAIAAPAGNCVNTAPGTPCLFQLTTTTNTGAQSPDASTYTSQFARANVGTSFSSPLVAAGAGLMLAVNPKLTPAKISERLRATARPFPTQSDNTPQPPVCHVPTSKTDVQDEECICTTGTCGAGMLDAGAAVLAAQRPVALATVDGIVAVGRTLTLDGTQSAASVGRTISSYTWSTVSATGGAATPSFGTPGAASTTLASPTAGSLTLRLTVVDNQGASDTADVTIDAPTSGGAISTPSAPPATPSSSGGGGGTADAWLLAALLAMLVFTTRARA